MGVGKEKPQIWFLPNTSDAFEANEETLMPFDKATGPRLEAHAKGIDKILMPS